MFGLFWGGGSLALYLAISDALVSEFDQALRAKAQELATATEYEQGKIDTDFTGELLSSFTRSRSPDYFQLRIFDGATLRRSPAIQDSDLPFRYGPPGKPKFWNLTLPDGKAGRAVSILFVPNKGEDDQKELVSSPPGPELALVVARHRTGLDHTLYRIGTALLLVGLATATAAVIVVVFLVRHGLRPLAALAKRAATIDATSLDLRFPTEGMPTELMPIYERLNDLLARLETSFMRERRLSADVAHELRTPIAELHSLAEVALKWPDDAPGTRRALQDALDIALRMQSITAGLLALARSECGLVPVVPESVPLASLVEGVLQPLADEADRRNVTLSLAVPADACWFVDATLLRAILENLLSNAIEYSPTGGSVVLRADTEGERGRLRVSNTTNNLDPDDLPFLFERFWRKDTARSSPLHSGLGLALTKAYAESLGMDIRAELTNRTEITLLLSGAHICRL